MKNDITSNVISDNDENEDYIWPVSQIETFSFHIDNEILNKLDKTFNHRDVFIIEDQESFNSFNNTLKVLVNASNKKSSNIELPDLDFSEQNLAVATYCENNRISEFSVIGIGGGSNLKFRTTESCLDEGNFSSFIVAFAALRKGPINSVIDEYRHAEDLPDVYTAR